jgi:ribosomal protein S18 acetylase RimI-like enzyme
MRIRPALLEDVVALATLERRLWRETYLGLIPDANLERHLSKTFGTTQQAQELADPACVTLLISEGDVLLGYALLRAHGPERDGVRLPFKRPVEVARFYLDRSVHGQGAAQRLLAEVLLRAGADGQDGLWLQVWEQNLRAIRFYAKAGFTDVGGATFRVVEQVDRDRVLAHALMAREL